MLAIFPTTYRDKFGEETTVIQNDGKNLRMVIRGVEFNGFMFDDFEPNMTDDVVLASFPLHSGSLCSCSIDCEIPIPVVMGSKTLKGVLHAHIELGEPKENGGIDHEEIQLELVFDENSFKSSGKHGWFENEFQEIQSVLPNDTYIKSCINCAFSDYSPSGYGAYGCLACFRNNKQGYLSCQDKPTFFRLLEKAETVQETYLCLEFEKRNSRGGYHE